MIAIIKAAPTPPEAKEKLMERAWTSPVVEEMLKRAAMEASRPEGLSVDFGLTPNGYKLSGVQAQEILQMRLQRLTGLEQDKVVNEYKEVMDVIADLLDILANAPRVTAMIKDELTEIGKGFGDKRRSEIVENAQDLSLEDLITPQDVVVTLSHTGYVKSQLLEEYRAQKRGGRGKQAAPTKEDDFIDKLFIANTHDYILCFSSLGQVYWLKVYEVPQGSRIGRGKPIINLFPLAEGEKINAILPVKEFTENEYIFMTTAKGTVKKTALTEFNKPRKSGIIAIKLDEGDYLIGAEITNGNNDIVLVSDGGKAVWFSEDDVRPMGRATRGVRGMKLAAGQQVLSLLIADDDQQSVLVATENGYGKRTILSDFRHSGRGTQGVKAIAISERNGNAIAARLVSADDEIMLITTGGVLIRTRVKEIRDMGRAAQGVTLINLGPGEKLSGLEKVVETDDDNEEDSE